MKKPEKRDISKKCGTDEITLAEISYDRGYNRCWDKREAWLRKAMNEKKTCQADTRVSRV